MGVPSPGRRRRLTVTTVLGLGLTLAAAPSASAQGEPVGGSGPAYFLAGAGNTTGWATEAYYYGDPADDMYFGDFVDGSGALGSDGRDEPMVRRGSTFIIRGAEQRPFVYGDPGDTVLVGDWNGDGTDTLAVRRGNHYFVKNDISTGFADADFFYGEPRDDVLVGNWDGDSSRADAQYPVTTDTLMVRRGNRYFVKNDTSTGVAEYDFYFGDPGDTVLVGDWATRGESGDHASQLLVRRGNRYFQSDEVWTAEGQRSGFGLRTRDAFAYGEPTDTAFVATLPRRVEDAGGTRVVYGDGLAVRRAAGPSAPLTESARASGEPIGPRSYAAVGDSITSGIPGGESTGIHNPGASSWLNGETAERLVLAGGWAVSAKTTSDMRANVVPTPSDVLVLLGGTNDLNNLPWEVTEANLKAISATIGARNTLLVAIPPVRSQVPARTAFNARLAALASQQGWRFADPWGPVSVNGDWAPGADQDGVHPTPETAVVVGRLITDEAWQAAARRTR
ncbi:SGNH/GDSL hydrolase family protein [Modestobacter marinus]|uniref:SGNH/GDSL hydrolase family protein n=1 Tax=Modestobacter marinus TaxID=477641 RepID=UPI001C94D99F|nr:SGNH/GDSL hydrolase family protein [Modestobacter marinus]